MTATTQDLVLDGRVSLIQPAQGYRAGLDAVLLAAAVEGAGHVLDMGCGAGAVMLCAAERLPQVQFTGLERDGEAADLARQNASLNGQDGRMAVQTGDACALTEDWQNRFDEVVSNPPFFDLGAISEPGAGREGAYIADKGLRAWLNAMCFACRPRGRVTLVHRAHELSRILAVLDRQAGEITVLPLYPGHGEPAKRVLVTARKGLRSGPLTLLPGRVLQTDGKASDWLRSVERGAPIGLTR